ncbi:MAG: histidinol-phosphate aminotransferase family protein [Rhodospirillales bacterium]|jgi:histidinol-phosphate aminotransferase|nr:histidinol-phosphate aminotransferase family protein [Rhodospirillales bacterium]
MIRSLPHLEEIRRDSDIISGREGLVCLDRNERISAFADEHFAAMVSKFSASQFSTYPDLGPLYQRIEDFAGLPNSRVAIGAGSDAIIRRAFQAFLSPGDVVVAPDPSYGMYAVWSKIFQAEFHGVPYGEGPHFKFSVADLIVKIEHGARICCVANPDQPTGSVLSPDEIRRIAEACERFDTLFLIDEAYYPFQAETSRSLIDEFENTILVRTFSKVGGIAGLRVGYALGAPNVIDALHAVRSPGEVNVLGAEVASYLLDHPEITEEFRIEVEAGRQILIKAAADLGFSAPTCSGNFQLLECPSQVTPANLMVGLRERGYLIKGGFMHPSLRNYVRVTLDGPDVIEPFVGKLIETVMTLTHMSIKN